MILPKHKYCGTKSLIVLGQYHLDDVFNNIGSHLKEYRINHNSYYESYYVKMNSVRYTLFKKNPHCTSCGLCGSIFLLEKPATQHIGATKPMAHFNLYAIENNELILMTKDHFIPRSQGGIDGFSNYNTMCGICNALKLDRTLSNKEVHERRLVYNSLG